MSANSESQRTAGVPFPPPLAFIGALAVGFAVQYAVDVHIARRFATIDALEVTGAVLILVGVVIASCAFACFRRARTSPFPERPSTALVLNGPFRFTRNPLYLSMALVHAGVALFSNALFPLLALVPAVMVTQHFVIAREERYLFQLFGAEYEAYCHSVRRWL